MKTFKHINMAKANLDVDDDDDDVFFTSIGWAVYKPEYFHLPHVLFFHAKFIVLYM